MAEVTQTKTMKKVTMGNSGKSKKTDMVFIASVNEDILHNILSRLPAKSFAFASCVNRHWNNVCDSILTRPKIISAFSRNPDKLRALEEVFDKVLSEPIRPHFVIANITCGFMKETLSLVTKKVGSRIPIIVSLVAGILGKEACNDKAGEVKDSDLFITDYAILLTIGYLPGMKVDVIPVIQKKGESEASIGDKFVMDIRNYVSVVSDHAAPACLILFGADTHHATEHILQKLDYAMPAETIIVGGQKSEFVYKRANEVRDVVLHEDGRRVLAGLVFARDRRRPAQAGTIQFESAISSGMSSVDLRYTAYVSVSHSGLPRTFLNAKRRGEEEVLNGNQILNDIEQNLLGNPSWGNDPYIGVIRRRKYSIVVEKEPKMMTSLVFYRVNEPEPGEYLSVEGAGIKTGDYFQVYLPDLKVAEASRNDVSSQFRNLKFKPNKLEVVGGFVFAGEGRTDSFFGRPNVNSSPFLENFPELPFGGIFCNGQIGRSLLMEEGEEKKETCIRSCLHVYSSVYLIVTYTSSS